MNTTISHEVKSQPPVADWPRSAVARMAGLACIISMVIVITSQFAIQQKIQVPGDPAQTAKNILSHQSQFRLSLLLYIIYAFGLCLFTSALYIILRPVNRTGAVIATICRFVYVICWVMIVLNLFTSLRLLTGDLPKATEPSQLNAFFKLYLSGSDAYYLGLLFWSISSSICSWLFWKSRIIPKAIAIFGLIASVWCVFCTAAFIVYPDFQNTINPWLFDSGMAIFELAFSFWLIFKAVPASR